LTQTVPAADVDFSEEKLQEIEQIMKNAAPMDGPTSEGM